MGRGSEEDKMAGAVVKRTALAGLDDLLQVTAAPLPSPHHQTHRPGGPRRPPAGGRSSAGKTRAGACTGVDAGRLRRLLPPPPTPTGCGRCQWPSRRRPSPPHHRTHRLDAVDVRGRLDGASVHCIEQPHRVRVKHVGRRQRRPSGRSVEGEAGGGGGGARGERLAATRGEEGAPESQAACAPCTGRVGADDGVKGRGHRSISGSRSGGCEIRRLRASCGGPVAAGGSGRGRLRVVATHTTPADSALTSSRGRSAGA